MVGVKGAALQDGGVHLFLKTQFRFAAANRGGVAKFAHRPLNLVAVGQVGFVNISDLLLSKRQFQLSGDKL